MIKKMRPWFVTFMLITVLVMGADLKEKTGMTLLSSTSVTIGTSANAAKQDLYTVPSGKNGIVEYIILRDPSASLTGCTDVNFGVGAGTTGSWIDAESGIADMTATSDYQVFERTNHISNEFSVIDGDDATANNRTFGIYPIAGATGAAYTVTIDVFGYVF